MTKKKYYVQENLNKYKKSVTVYTEKRQRALCIHFINIFSYIFDTLYKMGIPSIIIK